jgi:uncharacterized zinc-type alcohol dehydrogenase-like protein
MKIHAMAALSRGADLTPWSFECPSLDTWDCLVKVESCGLCYSDVHMIDNDWRNSRYPLVPGHEAIGLIADCGQQVGRFKPGDRVGIGWQRASCLSCRDCLRGNENLCSQASALIADGYGGFGDHLLIDSRFCFPLPKDLDVKRAGPLLCGGITVYAALRYAGMTSGQNIGVIGLGGLGHLAIQFAAKLGNRVTAFTTSETKRTDALSLGAAEVILMKEGRPITRPSQPLDIVIVTVPYSFMWDKILALLATDGTLTFAATPPEDISIDIDRLLSHRRRIMASPTAGRAMIEETLSLAARHQILPCVQTFPLSQINKAIRELRANRIRYRAVIQF